MIVKRSTRDYSETTRALLDAIEARKLRVFARIDHPGGAREVGLDLAEEQVVVLGNPRGGTPLMQSDPRVGIELPLRILLWREGDSVMLGYRDPRKMAGEYDLAGQEPILEQMSHLLGELVAEAAG